MCTVSEIFQYYNYSRPLVIQTHVSGCLDHADLVMTVQLESFVISVFIRVYIEFRFNYPNFSIHLGPDEQGSAVPLIYKDNIPKCI